MKQIHPANLANWLKDNPNGIILDVREPYETQIANLNKTGAKIIYSPMQETLEKIEDGELQIPEQTPIAVLCHHGVRSAYTAAYLEQNGYQNITNIQGGISAYTDQVDQTLTHY